MPRYSNCGFRVISEWLGMGMLGYLVVGGMELRGLRDGNLGV